MIDEIDSEKIIRREKMMENDESTVLVLNQIFAFESQNSCSNGSIKKGQGAGMKLKVAVSLILPVLTIKSFPISEFSCYEV